MDSEANKQLRSTAFGLTEQVPKVAEPQPSRHGDRIDYFDNLRAMAMTLGVLLHAGLAYAEPAQDIWLATDRYSSRIMDCSIWFVHLFRMALFFVIAGYFGKLVMARRGAREFLKNRAIRIAGPFVLFWPVLLVLMGATIGIGMIYIKQPQGIMRLIRDAANDPEFAQTLPARETLTTMHLWFLYYLMMFSLLAIGLHQRIRWLPWDGLFRRSWLIVLAPILLVPAAMAGGTPLAAPESFIPTWWPFAFYGFFYLAGWQLRGRESILDHWLPWALPLTVLIGVAYVGYYRLVPILDINNFIPLAGVWLIIEAVLTAYLSVGLVVLSLLMGRRWLVGRSKVMRWVADASYWTYLIHLPIVIFLQILLVEADLSVWIKFPVAVLATLFICGITYVVFVRYTPIGWLLNGKRSFP
jgi:glucans biosynthesis protein C